MSRSLLYVAPLLLGLATAQSVDDTPEVHPKITTYKCTTDGGCVAQNSAIVLESTQHTIAQRDDSALNCGARGTAPNTTVCPDVATCQDNCVLTGMSDYTAKGVRTNGSDLNLLMLDPDTGSSYSPRIYLLNEAEDEYEMLKLTGQEFTFDVDMSKLPCGMNSALYLSEMPADGGASMNPDVTVAGAKYGTGYCDAQCYVTTFVNGVGNINGSGVCCSEMDIWEANGRANQLAPHTCNQTGLYQCDVASGECDANGVCDKNGCSQNPYKIGHPEYYGPDMIVDTTRPFSVVTQFPADANGVLTEYRRLYVQDGKVIEMPNANVSGVPEQNFVEDEYCTATGAERYMALGATEGMGEALARGMVLVMSIWWDNSTFMEWLDQSSTGSGPCNATEGSPAVIQSIQPDTQVTFSNIRWGDIGSTFASSNFSSTKL